MNKILGVAAVCLLVLLAAAGFLHRNSWISKKEIREEALMYFHEEDYEKAIDLLEEARERKTLFSGSLDNDINCYLAESHYQLGEYEEAAKLYEKMIRNDPASKKYYLMMGECLRRQKETGKAAECYEKGYKNTKDPEFLMKLSEMALAQKDYETALSYVGQGEEAGGETTADFVYMNIVICERSGDYQAAYEAASRYIKLYPDDEKGKKEYLFLSTRIE